MRYQQLHTYLSLGIFRILYLQKTVEGGACATRHPCLHNGNCTDVGASGFQCSCPIGYIGVICQTAYSPCDSGPCGLYSTCTTPDGKKFECVCMRGYTGLTCLVTNQCLSGPCVNGGTCWDLEGSYKCRCPVYATGINCETITQPCGPQPCRWGAECTEVNNDFHCACPSFTTGKSCETVIPGKASDIAASKVTVGQAVIIVAATGKPAEKQTSNTLIIAIVSVNVGLLMLLLIGAVVGFRFWSKKKAKEEDEKERAERARKRREEIKHWGAGKRLVLINKMQDTRKKVKERELEEKLGIISRDKHYLKRERQRLMKGKAVKRKKQRHLALGGKGYMLRTRSGHLLTADNEIAPRETPSEMSYRPGIGMFHDPSSV